MRACVLTCRKREAGLATRPAVPCLPRNQRLWPLRCGCSRTSESRDPLALLDAARRRSLVRPNWSRRDFCLFVEAATPRVRRRRCLRSKAAVSPGPRLAGRSAEKGQRSQGAGHCRNASTVHRCRRPTGHRGDRRLRGTGPLSPTASSPTRSSNASPQVLDLKLQVRGRRAVAVPKSRSACGDRHGLLRRVPETASTEASADRPRCTAAPRRWGPVLR